MAEALYKETGFIWNRVVKKFKPKGILENKADSYGKQWGRD